VTILNARKLELGGSSHPSPSPERVQFLPDIYNGRRWCHYIITNGKQQNLAFLADPNDGTPLTANYTQDSSGEKVSLHPPLPQGADVYCVRSGT